MRRLNIAVLSATICSGLLLTGCEDPKKQIAQLEEEKKALGDQLLAASQDRDRAQAEATELRQSNSQLQSALAQAKQAPPPQAAPAGGAIKFVGALSTTDLGRANKPELSAKAKAELDAIAAAIKSDFADKHVYVIGHTDSDPIKRTKWKDNLELSCQRSMAVVRYLISKGIEPAQIFASGAGEFDPLAPNDNNADKAKNRRVEIYAGPKPIR
ncbi:MAG: OmpA family protein [Phycisphaerae bacterium]|nr:OmpA family protein [Phycisphaerae bacterium]